jgi:hypothetical protein
MGLTVMESSAIGLTVLNSDELRAASLRISAVTSKRLLSGLGDYSKLKGEWDFAIPSKSSEFQRAATCPTSAGLKAQARLVHVQEL